MMHPVTTGPGISGIFADELVALLFAFRVECNDERWRLYIASLGTHEYSLRVYAPDLHSEMHKVTRNPHIMESIRGVLADEGKAWKARVMLELTSAANAASDISSPVD
jgi:hypothetical protein